MKGGASLLSGSSIFIKNLYLALCKNIKDLA
jgi:hypothetical protein